MSELLRDYPDGKRRCYWPGDDALYLQYHDSEWGVPLRGDDAIFERLALEGFQAGLSWLTILKRREGFRAAFAEFKISEVAKFDDSRVASLMHDSGIIRNRSKIESTVHNARLAAALDGGLSQLVWGFERLPRRAAGSFGDEAGQGWIASNPQSEGLSKALKALGFKFVGPTTMYAMLQALGVINDHAPGCFRRDEIVESL